jgi:hypothetical protein
MSVDLAAGEIKKLFLLPKQKHHERKKSNLEMVDW